MFNMPCVILCGGKSSRMGEDKSLLPFSSSPSLAQYQFERLKPYFKNIYISSKSNKFDFLKNKDQYLILDNSNIYSPMIALKGILNSVISNEIFIITVDTPLVSIKSIQKIIEESLNYDITVAQTKKTHNLCGVFKANCIEKIDQLLENDIHKINFLLNSLNSKYVLLENDEEFINLNDKVEYNKALTLIS